MMMRNKEGTIKVKVKVKVNVNGNGFRVIESGNRDTRQGPSTTLRRRGRRAHDNWMKKGCRSAHNPSFRQPQFIISKALD
jgi:hypothetical protein